MESLKDKGYECEEVGIKYSYVDVKEAINDYLFILQCWDCIISKAVFDELKLRDICDKYELYYNSVYHQDISHEELFEAIFGDFEE